MKIVLDVPDVHDDSGKDMFDFVGELCDKYEIAATMSVIPEPAKPAAPPAYLDFCLTFTGTVGIGKAEEGEWVHNRYSLGTTLESLIQRAIDNGAITTDSNSELLRHNFNTTVKVL
jgi:hypothetical protein